MKTFNVWRFMALNRLTKKATTSLTAISTCSKIAEVSRSKSANMQQVLHDRKQVHKKTAAR